MPVRTPAVWFLLALAAAPAPAQVPDKPLTRIVFGSCADQDKPLPIFDAMAAAKPDLLVLLGDNIYADLDKSRKVTPEVIKEKYDTLARLPGWRKLKAACPVMATWDDHDFGKNDAGSEFLLKDESQKLFFDFFGAAPDDPRRTRKGVYTSATFGPVGRRVQVILLDTRYFRSAPKKAPFDPKTRVAGYLPNTDPGATVLGEEQWAWLADQLKQPAELRLLGSSIQVVNDDHPFEKWGNFPLERDRLFKLIRDTKANGVVILSGDRHLAELSLETTAVGYPLYDVTSSGFNQANKAWRPPEKNRYRVAAMPYGDNFGVVSVDWSGDNPRVGLQVRDEDGDVVFQQKVRLATLRADGTTVVAPAAGKAPEPKRPEGVLSPEEAIKKPGETVTVQFTVVGGRGFPNRVLLNSEKDFRSEKNLTVVVDEKAWTGAFARATLDTFRGKTVRVKGVVTQFKGAPQIIVEDAARLEIVDEKKD